MKNKREVKTAIKAFLLYTVPDLDEEQAEERSEALLTMITTAQSNEL